MVADDVAAFAADVSNTFELEEWMDDCESGLINFPGFCVRFNGIGGGNGIVDDDDGDSFSVSCAKVK